ncbi:MAG TPA: hypothetical protein VFY29_00390 [Terriglobia bacterium]|nr:hypothetical protein [Terriglobia bacterium]
MRRRSSIYRRQCQDLHPAPPSRRALLLLVPLLIVATGIRSWAAEPRVPDTLPERLSNREFRNLMTTLSEPGGAFQFENLLSNETDFPGIMVELKRTAPPGGAYLGVGPEQNFTYIAALRPRIAFIFDIRYQNVLEHLMYKAVFELSEDRAAFVSRLFSRRLPPRLPVNPSATDLFDAFRDSAPDDALFEKNLKDIDGQLTVKRGFPLTEEDRANIAHVYAAFRDFGPLMNYNSRGGISGGRMGNTPSYATLMTETDDAGREWSYLASEESYRFVRDLELRNLIVPLTGDFGGPRAIRAVGQYLRDHNAVVSAFYLSNVEGYLFQGGDWQGNLNGGATAFYGNAAALPLERSSAFIRWIPYYGNGGSSVQFAPILATIEDFEAGRLRASYFFPGRRGFGSSRGFGQLGGVLNNARSNAPRWPVSLAVWAQIMAHLGFAALAFVLGYLVRDPWLPRLQTGAAYAERFSRWNVWGAGRYRVGIPFARDVAFTLRREGFLDRLAKAIGLSREFQTGDAGFDGRVYIESEDGAALAALRESAPLRRAILECFERGIERVRSDGRLLYVEARREHREEGLAVLGQTREVLIESLARFPRGMADGWRSGRSRVVRASVWAMAAYAIGWLVSSIDVTVHIDQSRLIRDGLLAGLLALAAWFLFSLAILRRSSRTHSVLKESALIAMLAVPIFGIALVADMNRGLDFRQTTVYATVAKRAGTGAGKSGSYTVELTDASTPLPISGAFRVSWDVFRATQDGATIPIVIGPGRLGVPWLRSINGAPVE